VITTNDRILVNVVIAGDPEARDYFVDRFSNFVWSILVRDLRLKRELAEDLHAETFLRILEDDCRRLRNWSGEGNFVNYLGPIVRNLAMDHFRSPGVRRLDPEGESTFEPVAGEPDPERLAEAAEQRRLLHEALEDLTVRDRELIQRRHFDEQSYREIAEGMGYEISSVGVLLARAERRLKNAVDQKLACAKVADAE